MPARDSTGAGQAPAGAPGAPGTAVQAGHDGRGDRVTWADRVERVRLTPAADRLLARLIERHGPVMFHQSGGCCDGSAPMCYPRPEFRVGAADVLLGVVAHDTPFWMSADQYRYWRHTHLTVDVVPGRGSGFSLEAPEGVRFLLRSRLLTDEEAARVAAEPPLPTGADLAP